MGVQRGKEPLSPPCIRGTLPGASVVADPGARRVFQQAIALIAEEKRMKSFKHILDRAKECNMHISIAQAADREVLETVKEAQAMGLGTFTLIADKKKLLPMLDEYGVTVPPDHIVHAKDDVEAARISVAMVNSGEADLPMKGFLQTSTFLKAILNKETGLRGPGILSQVSIYEKPYGEGMQMVTDCAIHIAPTLDDKVAILRNAIDFCRLIGIERPRVAVLCGLEEVNPAMPETLDAAILTKMYERGQIKNAIVDGPFALDNAISPESAKHKQLSGEVAGHADILLVPNIVTGNVFHKMLTYIAHKETGVCVLGARVPAVITSRSDPIKDRLNTIALSQLVNKALKDKRGKKM